MSDEMTREQKVEATRTIWANFARRNGWYYEPFFVQVWFDSDGEVVDSVSHRGMTKDIIVQDQEYADCSGCDKLLDLDRDYSTGDGDNHVFCFKCS